MNTNKIEDMVRKVKNLIALASDGNPSEEESKSAMLRARKLMMKYNIEMEQVQKELRGKDDITDKAHFFKRPVRSWETELARTIAKNFRCVFYYYGNKGVAFYGHKEDAELAVDMFKFAIGVMDFHAEEYKEMHYIKSFEKRDRQLTKILRDSYCIGFAKGVREMFDAQTLEMKQEYGLVVMELVPVEVKESYEVLSEGFGTKRRSTYSISSIESGAYNKGKQKGSSLNSNYSQKRI